MSVDSQETVDLNYIKSQTFREVACDGFVGGLTPNEKIWAAFYTERYPLPRIVRYAIVETETPGEFKIDQSVPPVQVDGRSGIVRNVEFGVYLSLQTAIELRDWLNEHIARLGGKQP